MYIFLRSYRLVLFPPSGVGRQNRQLNAISDETTFAIFPSIGSISRDFFTKEFLRILKNDFFSFLFFFAFLRFSFSHSIVYEVISDSISTEWH